jgi:hypothetical protein
MFAEFVLDRSGNKNQTIEADFACSGDMPTVVGPQLDKPLFKAWLALRQKKNLEARPGDSPHLITSAFAKALAAGSLLIEMPVEHSAFLQRAFRVLSPPGREKF